MFNLNQIMSTEDIEMLTGMLIIYGVALMFSAMVSLLFYIFQSIGLFKMSKTLSFAHPWMAWVPIFNIYTFGKIGSRYVKQNGRSSANFGGWLTGLYIAQLITAIGCIASIIPFILTVFEMESTGTDIRPDNTVIVATLVLIISAFAVFIISIAYLVVYYIALWRVYAVFSNENATVFLIISILFNVATPFIIFAIRNNEPVIGNPFPILPNEEEQPIYNVNE